MGSGSFDSSAVLGICGTKFVVGLVFCFLARSGGESLAFGLIFSGACKRPFVGSNMHRLSRLTLAIFLSSLLVVSGCEGLVPHDTKSLLFPSMQRSEIVGVVAGCGTTFAAMPDLIAMLRRRSSAGMNPRMAAIMGMFQVLWVYYGLLILSRPVVLWNIIAVLVNSLSVGAYLFFAREEKRRQTKV